MTAPRPPPLLSLIKIRNRNHSERSNEMSKNTTKTEPARTVAEIENAITEALDKRREINRRLTTLRAEHRAAVAAEERARAEEIGARILAAAGDREALAALVAEVAESAETADSGAAPPAPEDADDGEEHGQDHGYTPGL